MSLKFRYSDLKLIHFLSLDTDLVVSSFNEEMNEEHVACICQIENDLTSDEINIVIITKTSIKKLDMCKGLVCLVHSLLDEAS